MSDIIAATVALAGFLGFALLVTTVVERRRRILREEIGRKIGIYRTTPSNTIEQLETDLKKQEGQLVDWLPSSLGVRLSRELRATGGRISVIHLMIAASLAAAVALAVGILLHLPYSLVIPAIAGCAIAGPIMLLRTAQTRFQAAFLLGFPDALGLIVRAVRAGLPVSDAIGTIADEVAGPVGAEFRLIYDSIRIGVDLEKELIQAAIRIRLVEFRFFVIALALQRQTGGNLAETLENLASTIRRRKELYMKSRAIMSESRASAWVIGGLPFACGALMFFFNPTYHDLFVNDPRGHKLIGGALLSLVVGILTMRFMIKRAAE